MSVTDTTEYWLAVKYQQPYMGKTFYHIGEVCSHYNPKTGNVLTSKYLNDINCHCCKKMIADNGNIYGLIEGLSPKEQRKIDKEKKRFKHGKCSKCGKPMVLRKNKVQNKEFKGCSQYPNCKHTDSIN